MVVSNEQLEKRCQGSIPFQIYGITHANNLQVILILFFQLLLYQYNNNIRIISNYAKL